MNAKLIVNNYGLANPCELCYTITQFKSKSESRGNGKIQPFNGHFLCHDEPSQTKVI